MDTNYSLYEQVCCDGMTAEDALRLARSQGKDWSFGIRMLRSVYCMTLVEARAVLLRIEADRTSGGGS